MRPLLPALILALPLAAADPPDLAKARDAHKAEVARLRDKLLADIDAVIRREDAAGSPIDYLLKEKKGFADNGVVPILPKLRPAAGAYEEAKGKADERLAVALDRAGRKEEAKELRPKAEPVEKPVGPQTKDELTKALAGTTWTWPKAGEVTFNADGSAHHLYWKDMAVTWKATTWRRVEIRIGKGPSAGKVASLMVDDDLKWLTGKDFDGSDFGRGRRQK